MTAAIGKAAVFASSLIFGFQIAVTQIGDKGIITQLASVNKKEITLTGKALRRYKRKVMRK